MHAVLLLVYYLDTSVAVDVGSTGGSAPGNTTKTVIEGACKKMSAKRVMIHD